MWIKKEEISLDLVGNYKIQTHVSYQLFISKHSKLVDWLTGNNHWCNNDRKKQRWARWVGVCLWQSSQSTVQTRVQPVRPPPWPDRKHPPALRQLIAAASALRIALNGMAKRSHLNRSAFTLNILSQIDTSPNGSPYSWLLCKRVNPHTNGQKAKIVFSSTIE